MKNRPFLLQIAASHIYIYIKIISQNKVQCLKYFYSCCTAVAAMIIEKSSISDG